MLSRRSRILVLSLGLGLLGGLAWWPWSRAVGEAWAAETSAPGWGLFWLAWGLLAILAAAAGRLSGTRADLAAGALAGGLVAGVGFWFGGSPALGLRGQWPVWALVQADVVGRAPLLVALADTLSRSALWATLASWAALGGGAVCGLAGASSRAGTREEPLPVWVVAPPALALAAGTSAFVVLTAISQVMPAFDEAPGAVQLVDTDRLVLVAQALLTVPVAALLARSTTLLARGPAAGWRVVAVSHGLLLALFLASPWLTVWFARDMGFLRQWPIYAAAPFVGTALGVGLGWRTPSRSPTWGELLEEALLLGFGAGLVVFLPGGFAMGQALSTGVAPLIPVLDTGLSAPPGLEEPLRAFRTAPDALFFSTLFGLLIGACAGLPARWLLGPPREE